MLSRNRKTKMNRGTRDTIAHVAGETEQALQPPGLENQRDQAVGAPTDSRFRPTETSGIVTDRVRADLCALWAAIAMAVLQRCGDRRRGKPQLERGQLEVLHRLAVLGQLQLPGHQARLLQLVQVH